MKFFQVDQHYIDQLNGEGLVLTMNKNVNECDSEELTSKKGNQFTLYKIPCTYNGEKTLISKENAEGKTYELNKGDEIEEFKMFENEYKQMAYFKTGDTVSIAFEKNGKWTNWKPKKIDASEVLFDSTEEKNDDSGKQPAQDTPPKSYTSRSTNDSIESQVQLKEIAPVLRVACEAGLVITKPLPEGFMSNVQTVYYNLKNVMSLIPTKPHNTDSVEAIEESSKKESQDDDLPF